MAHNPQLEGGDALLRFTVARDDGFVECTVVGEIDLSTQPVLLGQLLAAADAAATAVVVDLSNVSFMDSSGLHALLTARRNLTEKGVDLRLRNPSPVTRRVLQVSGVEPLFAIVES